MMWKSNQIRPRVTINRCPPSCSILVRAVNYQQPLRDGRIRDFEVRSYRKNLSTSCKEGKRTERVKIKVDEISGRPEPIHQEAKIKLAQSPPALPCFGLANKILQSIVEGNGKGCYNPKSFCRSWGGEGNPFHQGSSHNTPTTQNIRRSRIF